LRSLKLRYIAFPVYFYYDTQVTSHHLNAYKASTTNCQFDAKWMQE